MSPTCPQRLPHHLSWAFPGFYGMDTLVPPLNLFVMGVGVHHSDIPFLSEASLSQLLEVLADEGLRWVPSQELALDEGPAYQGSLPSRGGHTQWLVRGGIQKPEPLASIWATLKSFLGVSWDCCDCITVSLLLCSVPLLPFLYRYGSQGLCPINFCIRASSEGLFHRELNLRHHSDLQLFYLVLIFQWFPGISHLLLSPAFGFASLCLFFPAPSHFSDIFIMQLG